MRQQLFIPLKVFIAAGIATSLFFSQSSTRAGDEPYNPYGYGSESSVISGFSDLGSGGWNYSSPIVDYGPGGIFHSVFFGNRVGDQLSLYYSNNDFGPGSQGWHSLEKINTSTEIYRDPVYTRITKMVDGDVNGGAHFVWEEKPTRDYFDTLPQFQQTSTDLWYRARARDGELAAEIKLTNYAAEVAQVAADAERCRSESPPHGRAWWARPRAKRPTIESTSEASPVFSWEKNWYAQPFDPITGQRCTNLDNPPTLPIEYQSSLLVRDGVTGSDKRVTTTTGSNYFVPRFLLIDHDNNQHLFFERILFYDATLFYSWKTPGGDWSAPTQIGRSSSFYILQFNDFALDEENVIHLVLYSSPWYIRVRNFVVEEVTVPTLVGRYPTGVAVNRDGQPFIVDNDGEVHSFINDEWRVVEKISSCVSWGSCSWIHGLEITENDTLLALLTNGGYYYSTDSPALNVMNIPVEAREGEGAALGIDGNTTVNVATGNLQVNLPLFQVIGVGPQINLSLQYGSLSRTRFQSFAHDSLPGWRLISGMRIRKYANHEGNNPEVWLEKTNGEIVVLETPSDPEAYYEYYYRYGDEQFLRLDERDDGSWELIEEDGTKSYFLKSGQIDFTQDASGNVLDYEYSDNPLTPNVTEENLVRITDAQDRSTTFEYSAENLLTRVRDPELHDYTLQYYELDEAGGGAELRLLKSVTRVRTDGQPSETWSFVYHGSNDMTHECPKGGGLCPTKRAYIQSITNPRGFTSEYYFEIGGRFTKALNPSGDFFQASYDNLFNDHTTPLHCESILPNPSDWYTPARDLKTTITDWRGNTATFESDFETATVWIASDALRGTAQGGTLERSFRVWYSYDDYAAYHVFKECESDKRGATTLYEWIAGPPGDFVKLQLEDVNLPDIPTPIHYTYTADHEVATVTDPLGNQTQYFYEDARNPHLRTKIIEPED